MTDPLVTAAISAGSAFVGGLISVLLTPRLQHYFWKHQRRVETRLATIDELNKLSSEFLFGVTSGPYTPPADFHLRMQATIAKLRVWFSSNALQVFNRMDAMIGPNHNGRLGATGQFGIYDFIEARDATLRVLYKEAGF